MSYINIPLDDPTAPWLTFRFTLSGTRYNLEARYNTRADQWFLSVYDAAGNPILLGAPLLIQRSLTSQYPTLDLPPGALFVVDDTGKQTQPGLASFLKTHRLIYQEP